MRIGTALSGLLVGVAAATSFVLPAEVEERSLTYVEQPEGTAPFINWFVSLLNPAHPGNRIGYRFQEHLPFVAGEVPKGAQAAAEKAKADEVEKGFAAREGVFSRAFNISEEGWVAQKWTFYISPRKDGFDMLWVVSAGEVGLNEYYSAQHCFRMSGLTNKGWRRKIAEAPAFSELDLWAKQDEAGKPRTSLTYVVRGGKWEPIPAIDQHVACRTPAGLKLDTVRSDGDLAKITEMGPYGPSRFEPDVDCGLIVRTDAEGKWVLGLYWEGTTHVTDHHPADCMHALVNLGPLPAGGKRAIRGRVYWMQASKEELLSKWRDEFKQ